MSSKTFKTENVPGTITLYNLIETEGWYFIQGWNTSCQLEDGSATFLGKNFEIIIESGLFKKTKQRKIKKTIEKHGKIDLSFDTIRLNINSQMSLCVKKGTKICFCKKDKGDCFIFIQNENVQLNQNHKIFFTLI